MEISDPYVTWVGVKNSTVIARMAFAGQTSTEAMAKKITQLKQSTVQFQAELAETVKTTAEEKHRSLDELRMALEVKHEQETQRLQELHAREKMVVY
jgi:ABC-type hemin transport system ATPase subunit